MGVVVRYRNGGQEGETRRMMRGLILSESCKKSEWNIWVTDYE